MKHLLTGIAMVAALAVSAPTWAQSTSPGGNALGLPGPNPGGPGLTPYTTGPRQAPPAYTPPPAATMARPAPTPPSAADEALSATPTRQARNPKRTGPRG